MADFSLIETFGWTRETGFVRLAAHLARMEASAKTLGFQFDLETVSKSIYAKLKQVQYEIPEEKFAEGRFRAELARDGELDVKCVSFEQSPPGTIFKLAIANTRLSSKNSLLRHKTSARNQYASARDEFPVNEINEVLLLNENELVCEGTITNLFVQPHANSQLLTPSLGCGLLPGILRAELLEQGLAKEAYVNLDDLSAAHQLFVGNSLRGLVKAEIFNL
ncbi:MAG: aminotransferase class IV family protein [Pseudomonadota bacterium]